MVQKHPELITFQNEILATQIKLAVDATAEATKFANEIGGVIGGIQNEVDGLLGKLGNLACKLTFGLSKDCGKTIDKINGLRQKIDVTRATLKALQEAADIAAKNRDGTKRLIDKLNDEYNNAVKGIAEGTYQATVTVAEAELKSQEKIIEESRKIVEEAQRLGIKLSDEFDKVAGVVDEIKKAVDKFNPITLVVQNWLGDIDEASGEYIKASHRAGEKMLLNSGNPLSEYKDWLSCYSYHVYGKTNRNWSSHV